MRIDTKCVLPLPANSSGAVVRHRPASDHSPESRGAVSGPTLQKAGKLEIFEETILPHLNAAYNLARWLLRNDQDAQDAVQEASLRAYRFFDGYKGGDAKAWLL